jgi:hypothetical protein
VQDAGTDTGLPCLDDAGDPPADGDGGTSSGFRPTGVTLTTNDPLLQSVFDAAEKNERGLVTQFTPTMKVLVEGGGYGNIWLETQPMGGEMYAKRNLEVAYNNIDAFLLTQRADGRLPGMITAGNALVPDYNQIQGLFFVGPAFNLYYLLGHDKVFLQRLYDSLVKFDAYLWKTRDSNGDGCLETWCVWDTGEDHSTKYGNAPNAWSADTPPTGYDKVPIQSMDFMGYSFEMRSHLAKISKILGNGQESSWGAKAQVVKDKINSYLWSPTDHACFDRDKNGQTLKVLVHNNLRVMWHGGFSQQMADEFIKYHLVNRNEFWTRMPLPSIAVSDPLFRNNAGNDWSGQPEGLTFQRAIRALENYGHFGELTLLGKKLLGSLGSGSNVSFPQQWDPFTGLSNHATGGSYGPSALSALEYISRMYGIHIQEDTIYWSGLQDANSTQTLVYTQNWNGNTYRIENGGGTFRAYVGATKVFEASNGVRVVTNLAGAIRQVIGIDSVPANVSLQFGPQNYMQTVKPNEVYKMSCAGLALESASPFYDPGP